MVQCAAAELHKIRVLGRVPGVKEGSHLPGWELPGNSSMQALNAGPAACSTVGSGFPGSQDVEAEVACEAESGCGWHREQGTEYKGGWWEQERQAGGVCVTAL